MIEGTRILSKGNVYSQCKKYHESYKREEYSELAYIITDGNQWIDTGYIPDSNTRVVMDVFLFRQNSYPKCLFGARKGTNTSSNGSAFCLWAMTETSYRTDYNSRTANLNTLRPKGRRLIDKNKNSTTIDTSSWSLGASTFDSSVTMRLFANHSDRETSVDTRRPQLIFYSCQIYDNGTLVRDFIPVLKNGIAQLYDKIEDSYYESLGTKSFIAGPELYIPEEYTEVEYIESDFNDYDQAPYIDTGILAAKNVNVSLKFKFSQVTRWTHSTVIGGRGPSGSYANRLGFGHNKSFGWRFDYASSNYGKTDTNYLNEEIVSLTNNLATLNHGIEISAGNSNGFTGSYTLWLFAYNTGNTLDAPGELRMYWCDIYAPSGQRALRPVKRKSDGLAGMYDLVEKKFHTCVEPGRNRFIAGPMIEREEESFPSEPVNADEPAFFEDINNYLNLGENGILDDRPVSASNLKRIFQNLLGNDIFLEYTPLEYLESNYNYSLYQGSYIETDIIPTSSISSRGKIRFISCPSENPWYIIYGARTRTNGKDTNQTGLYWNQSSKYWLSCLFNSSNNFASGIDFQNADTEFIMRGTTIKLNENSYTIGKGSSPCQYPLRLFSVNTSNSLDTPSNFRMYYIDFNVDGIDYNFRPVKRIFDGALGMYDLAHRKFYPGQGMAFTAGPETSQMMDTSWNPNYIQLQYIDTSNTQYVDTGYIPNETTRVILDVERLTNSSADHFFGVRTGNQTKNSFAVYIYNSGWRSVYGDDRKEYNEIAMKRYLIDKNRNVTTFNNTEIILTSAEQDFTAEGFLYLLALNNVGSNSSKGTFRFYSCKIYDNDILVRNYIPAKRMSDNAIGMYDLVHNRFYTNSGSGSFSAGPEI